MFFSSGFFFPYLANLFFSFSAGRSLFPPSLPSLALFAPLSRPSFPLASNRACVTQVTSLLSSVLLRLQNPETKRKRQRALRKFSFNPAARKKMSTSADADPRAAACATTGTSWSVRPSDRPPAAAPGPAQPSAAAWRMRAKKRMSTTTTGASDAGQPGGRRVGGVVEEEEVIEGVHPLISLVGSASGRGAPRRSSWRPGPAC